MLDLFSEFLLCSRIKYINAYLAVSAKFLDEVTSTSELKFFALEEFGWSPVFGSFDKVSAGLFGQAEDGVHTISTSAPVILPFSISESEKLVSVFKVSEPGMLKALLFLTHAEPLDPADASRLFSFASRWLKFFRCNKFSESLTWGSFVAKASAKIRDFGKGVCRVCVIEFAREDIKKYERVYGREAVELFVTAFKQKLEEMEKHSNLAAYVSPFVEIFIVTEAWKATEIRVEIERFLHAYFKEEGVLDAPVFPRFRVEQIKSDLTGDYFEVELDDILDQALATNSGIKTGTYR